MNWAWSLGYSFGYFYGSVVAIFRRYKQAKQKALEAELLYQRMQALATALDEHKQTNKELT